MNFVFVEKEPVLHEAPPARSGQHQLPALVQSPISLARALRAKAPAPARPANRRIASRKHVRLTGEIALDATHWLTCTVHDMSATGASLEMRPQEFARHGRDPLPDRFYLVIESLLERSVVECSVQWRKDDRAGVKFMGPIDATVKKLPPRPVRKPATLRRR